jgi:hypothetical protein
MKYKDIFIILLLILIIFLIKKKLHIENFIASTECLGLSTPLGMSCGNYLVNNKYCLPDKNDCFFLNNENRCWCKVLDN